MRASIYVNRPDGVMGHYGHSVYNIQRLYLDFLQALDMREDTLPGDATPP
jgi:hypothetical protein